MSSLTNWLKLTTAVDWGLLTVSQERLGAEIWVVAFEQLETCSRRNHANPMPAVGTFNSSFGVYL